MCKKFKFDHTNKWYMHNPAPVLENDARGVIVILVGNEHGDTSSNPGRD